MAPPMTSVDDDADALPIAASTTATATEPHASSSTAVRNDARALAPTAATIERAAAALRDGDVIVVPTDTVYGLAASAAQRDAVERMFALKQRPLDVRVAVLVADERQADEYVELGDVGRRLARAFWPGQLTICARRRDVDADDDADDDNDHKRCRRLAAGDAHTLGVRCPADETVRALASRVGPVAATSANLHKQPTCTTGHAAAAMFPSIDVVVDDGERPGAASTVVSLVADDDGGVALRVEREGPISRAQLDAALARVERDGSE